MEKGKSLADLRPGDSFIDCVFAVTQAEVREAANGTFVALTLRDSTGQAPARKFQASEDEQRLLLTSALVCVSGRIEAATRYAGQVNLSAVRKVTA
ncbi:MAG TPA: hypothetical protein VFW40_04330, partial [Capsulimonadaceae bacterium]|nr:hypothetical protein [Capsulimonadaceae bacterium]